MEKMNFRKSDIDEIIKKSYSKYSRERYENHVDSMDRIYKRVNNSLENVQSKFRASAIKRYMEWVESWFVDVSNQEVDITNFAVGDFLRNVANYFNGTRDLIQQQDMIDEKFLQWVEAKLMNPECKKGFVVAMMNDGDYNRLKALYQELDTKDKEIENNLYNIIYASKEKGRKAPVKAEEKIMQDIEKFSLFGFDLNLMLKNYMCTPSLRECENYVPILRQERKGILEKINAIYNNYEKKYNRMIYKKKTRTVLLMSWKKKNNIMDEEFVEWITELRK